MTAAPTLVDRGALYYPFIHVRDENWLKATLLCFPFVDRMVPGSYEVNDSEAAAFFAARRGRSGRPMLGRRDLGDPATEHARSTLLHKLKEDLSAHDLAGRFSRQAAKAAYADGASAFQIHEYKLGSALIEFLRSNGLAWAARDPIGGKALWWAVHPVLGEAIMSTNAVALANAHDLEIVTSDGPIHQALLGTTAADVYDILVRQQVFGMPRSDVDKVNDLMQFVIMSAFDLENLSLEDIAELNRERRDVSALKAHLLAQVADVGAIPDRDAWQDLLPMRTKEVLDEWRERASVRSLLRSDANELADEFKGFAKEVAPAVVSGGAAAVAGGAVAAAGGATAAILGAIPGLVVGVIFGTVHLVKKWKESQRPYRFLSRLERAGARPRHILEGSLA